MQKNVHKREFNEWTYICDVICHVFVASARVNVLPSLQIAEACTTLPLVVSAVASMLDMDLLPMDPAELLLRLPSTTSSSSLSSGSWSDFIVVFSFDLRVCLIDSPSTSTIFFRGRRRLLGQYCVEVCCKCLVALPSATAFKPC